MGDAHPGLGAGPDRPAAPRRRGTRTSPHRDESGRLLNSVRSHRHPGRGDARQRGELPDQEAVRRRAGSGLHREPGPDMTQRLGARSGHLVRPRRGHQLPAGPANSDCILFMGSNMAEAHPVGFRWPMKAKEKGATLIHVDPRFTRMSALCDVYVGIRAGSDIAFLGGLVNYVLSNDRWFRDYVLNYTNASMHRRGGLPGHRGPGRAVQRLPRGRGDRHLRRAGGPLGLRRRRGGRSRRTRAARLRCIGC